MASSNKQIKRNPKIQQAWDAALDVLKPSEKDLERGLELHASSLVFESYGFSPVSALDTDKYNAAIESGATDLELDDLREENSPLHRLYSERENQEFLEAFDAAGVDCIFQNAGQESSDPMRLIKRLARYTHVTDLKPQELRKAVTPDDIVDAWQRGQRCLYLTTNGVPLRLRYDNVRDELGLIRVFAQLGVRMMHLTYNRRNALGDGVGEPRDGGLTDFGETAIAEMNKLGIIVDVSHSGWRTSLEAAKASAAPMVASHTTAAALYEHVRSKPDDVIRAICDTDGLVGICCISYFLGKEGNINTFLDHIDYVAKKFGTNRLAIGTDVAYRSRFADEAQTQIARRECSPSQSAWEQLWPKGALEGARHTSLSWTNWPLFTVGLVQRGYSDNDIQLILGQNMLRVCRAVWDGAYGHYRKTP